MSEQVKRKLDFLKQLTTSPQSKPLQCKYESLKHLYTSNTICPIKQASKEERTSHNLTSNSLSYGEIIYNQDYNSLQEAFRIAQPKKGGIFYDLGSGVGKGVVAASLLHSFEHCRGVELLGSLYELSCKLREGILQNKEVIAEEMERLGQADYEQPTIEFIHADIRDYDWSDGTFIFASTTCYDPTLMKAMSQKALLLKGGSYFVTLTKKLEPDEDWHLVDSVVVEMSWGQATMLIQQRKLNQQQQNRQNSQVEPQQQHNELIEYLKQENRQLSEQAKELGNLLALNKQAMKILTPSSPDDQNRALVMVLKNLQEENITLHRQIDKLIMERNEAQNLVLINQQITEEAQRHEKELVSSLEVKIATLQYNLSRAETSLSKMEQLKPEYDEVAGVVIKYRDVAEPDVIVMKMHNEIQIMNEQLIISLKEHSKLKQEKDAIKGLNFKLTAEIIKLKSTAMTHHGNKLILQSHPEQLIAFQQNMLDAIKQNDDSSEESSFEESPLMSPLPAKNDNTNSSQKPNSIPKLDLTRAKQIQEINAKRQMQQVHEKQKSSMDFQILERIQKLEKALDDVRKNYQREMLINRSLIQQNDQLTRDCDELQNRVTLLINSNGRYQEKIKKLHKQYQFLQQFYFTNKDMCQTTGFPSNNRRQSMTPTDQEVTDLQFDTSYIDANDAILSNEMQVIEQQQYQQQQFNTQNVYQYYMPNSEGDSKKFLLSLAQQMYTDLQDKLDNLLVQQDMPHQLRRDHRSLSDIIDYSNTGFQQYVYYNKQ